MIIDLKIILLQSKYLFMTFKIMMFLERTFLWSYKQPLCLCLPVKICLTLKCKYILFFYEAKVSLKQFWEFLLAVCTFLHIFSYSYNEFHAKRYLNYDILINLLSRIFGYTLFLLSTKALKNEIKPSQRSWI